MKEYRYSERKIVRISIWSIFATGTIILLTMFVFILRDITSFHKNSGITSVLIVLATGLLWFLLFAYCLANSPVNLVVTDKTIKVHWNTLKKKKYLWNEVSLKKTGKSGFVLILIRDSEWFIPRWVFLDGSNKQYKEFISRIKEIKYFTES